MASKTAWEYFAACALCPRECKIDRISGQRGFCGAGDVLRVARASLHKWEEPCICQREGSGTVFFSHCTLGCVYCQNREISHSGKGIDITVDRLSDIYLELQDKGACNINLVTPMHFAPLIVESLERVRGKSLTIPVLINCGGYEKIETVKMFDGLCDIWLPDFKYADEKYAVSYSSAPDYPETALKAIDQMLRQSGPPVFDGDSLCSGVIVRHLLLPGALASSVKAVEMLYSRYGDDIIMSLMSQYTPMGPCERFPILERHVPKAHYDALTEYAASIGVTRCYIQEGGSDSSSFIPSFCGEGVVSKLK